MLFAQKVLEDIIMPEQEYNLVGQKMVRSALPIIMEEVPVHVFTRLLILLVKQIGTVGLVGFLMTVHYNL